MSTTASKNDNNNLTKDTELRLCHASNTSQYYCEGPEYEQFSIALDGLIANKTSNNHHWGHRALPAPPNSTVLWLGNSHTRQLFYSLVCQYNDDEHIISYTSSGSRMSNVATLKLIENVTVYAITNHWLVYSPEWPRLAAQTLGLSSLHELDAIVLGRLNDLDNSQGTNFAKWLEQEFPSGANFSLQSHPPPQLLGVHQAFRGPIVVVGMFAAYSESHFQSQLQQAAKIRSTTPHANIALVNARRYVPALGECGNDQVKGIGTCLLKANDKNSKGRSASQMHRCVGARGGHPSLVVWDVVEALYQLL